MSALHALSELLQSGTARHHPVFDFGGRKLDFEITRMLFRQFIRSNENWLEPRQFRDLIDLLLEQLKFIERILVFRSHDVYPTLRQLSAGHRRLNRRKNEAPGTPFVTYTAIGWRGPQVQSPSQVSDPSIGPQYQTLDLRFGDARQVLFVL